MSIIRVSFAAGILALLAACSNGGGSSYDSRSYDRAPSSAQGSGPTVRMGGYVSQSVGGTWGR